MFLNKSVYSHVSGELYANYGAEVTVIANHGNVLIVEHDGLRFPCPCEYLSDDLPGAEIKETDKVEFKLF